MPAPIGPVSKACPKGVKRTSAHFQLLSLRLCPVPQTACPLVLETSVDRSLRKETRRGARHLHCTTYAYALQVATRTCKITAQVKKIIRQLWSGSIHLPLHLSPSVPSVLLLQLLTLQLLRTTLCPHGVHVSAATVQKLVRSLMTLFGCNSHLELGQFATSCRPAAAIKSQIASSLVLKRRMP